MVRQWSPPNYFASKMQSILWLFLVVGNKKFQRANATAIVYDTNEYPPDDSFLKLAKNISWRLVSGLSSGFWKNAKFLAKDQITSKNCIKSS